MDSYFSNRMYEGVYEMNKPEQSDQVLGSVSDHALKHGNHKKLNVMLHEKVALQTIQKRMRHVMQ